MAGNRATRVSIASELPHLNQGLSPAKQSTMLSLLGNPRSSYSQTCQPLTNQTLKNLIQVANVGPFQVQGLKPAVESLKTVMAEIKQEHPTTYSVLGSAGMLCARFVRGSTTSISNHSWGTAIDLTILGILDIRGNARAQRGLLRIAPIFNRHGWYWGAAFGFEDSMHFEVADETLRAWNQQGLLSSNPAALAEPVLSLGDRGPEVKELQTLLNRKGANLAVDGDFGQRTFVAVRAFQAQHGLVVDGIVGRRTWAALRE